jgi:hypothetical protein
MIGIAATLNHRPHGSGTAARHVVWPDDARSRSTTVDGTTIKSPPDSGYGSNTHNLDERIRPSAANQGR